jgi:hypothetical protein
VQGQGPQLAYAVEPKDCGWSQVLQHVGAVRCDDNAAAWVPLQPTAQVFGNFGASDRIQARENVVDDNGVRRTC